MPTQDSPLKTFLDSFSSFRPLLDNFVHAVRGQAAKGVVFELPKYRDGVLDEVGSVQGCIDIEGIQVVRFDGSAAVSAACDLWQTWRKPDDQPPVVSDRGAGVVLASDVRLVGLAEALQVRREQMQDAYKLLPRGSGPVRRGEQGAADAPVSGRARSLHGTDATRLHPPQAFREIRVIARDVESMGFCWTDGSRVVDPIEREKLLKWLAKTSGDAQGPWDRSVLDEDDRWFAVVREQLPYPVLNIRYVDGIEGSIRELRRKKQLPKIEKIACPVPVLLIGAALPTIHPLESYPVPSKTPVDVQRRSDVELMEEPLIRKLRVYRFKDPEHVPNPDKRAKRVPALDAVAGGRA